MRNHFFIFAAQGFGTGRSPWAPGTVGTLPGVGLYLVLAPLPLPAYIAIILLLFYFGTFLCELAAEQLGESDPPSVVWDEIVGVLVTLTAVPLTLINLILAFILFRIFDIWKPWPISWIQHRIHGGDGIMLDDVVAGVMAGAMLNLLMFLMPAGIASMRFT